MFAQAAGALSIGAIYAIPLQLGAIRIGVLALYRSVPGPLDGDQVASALLLSEMATHLLLSSQAGDLEPALLEIDPTRWAEVHQATGMISAQLEISLDDAYVRLRSHAFATGRPLDELAADIVARRTRLDE